jgi:hypothetical protein
MYMYMTASGHSGHAVSGLPLPPLHTHMDSSNDFCGGGAGGGGGSGNGGGGGGSGSGGGGAAAVGGGGAAGA